ncbi:MAG: hypothetical protein J0L92_33525 [Deltaproteobacteria bacterium]|nr:hypothetical protein [Deltaproteobacteria bacterium]
MIRRFIHDTKRGSMVRRPPTGISESTRQFVRRIGAGSRSLVGVTPIGFHRIAVPIDSPVPAPAIWQPYGRDEIIRRGVPWRTERFRSPRVLRKAQLVARAGTLRYGLGLDYPQQLRVGAGVVTSRGIVRALYTDPAHAGVPDTTPQTLRAVDVGAQPGRNLGVSTRPVVVAASNSRGQPAQFFGIETTQVSTGGTSRPVMVVVAETIGSPTDIEYLLVDYDLATGEPVVTPIVGVPRSAAFSTTSTGAVYANFPLHRVAPGIAAGPDSLLMSVAVRGERAEDLDLVIGAVDVSTSPARFRETDRVPISGSIDGSPITGYPVLYDALPLLWHPLIRRWIAMYVVDEWEMRFHVLDESGRFVRRTPASPMVSAENRHAGVAMTLHPETGHVVLQTGHNAVTLEVQPDQSWVNIWSRWFDPIGPDHPPETWPPLTSEGVAVVRGIRWSIAPTTFHDWEFQGAGLGTNPRAALVSRPQALPPHAYQAYASGTLGEFAATPSSAGGVHRIVRTPYRSAAYVIVEPRAPETLIKVAFVEDGS